MQTPKKEVHFFFFSVGCIVFNCSWQLIMFDKKQKSCVKRIHLVTDDGLSDRNAFYIVKIVFLYPLFKCLYSSFFYFLRKTCHDHFYNGLVKSLYVIVNNFSVRFNPISANPTQLSNTLKQFVSKMQTNCLSVLDHFVGFAIKGLSIVVKLFSSLMEVLHES